VAAKYGAFLTWISATSFAVVKLHITFMTFKRFMEVAAVEFAAAPNEKLLAGYLDAPGAR
jgi:hypothetical protein